VGQGAASDILLPLREHQDGAERLDGLGVFELGILRFSPCHKGTLSYNDPDSEYYNSRLGGIATDFFAIANIFMKKSSIPEICQRICQVRLEVAGPRGKASFAKRLGLSASTYAYYESTRVPPADVLVRIAETAGVDLCWLLTGHAGQPGVGADRPIVQRAAKLLAEHPNAASALSAFLEILAEGLSFPAKPPAEPDRVARADRAPAPHADTEAEAQQTPAPQPGKMPAAPDDQPGEDAGSHWIPILGRSAAGVPQFWDEADASAGVTTLGELIERHCGCPDRLGRSAVATEADHPGQEIVQIVTLRGQGGAEIVEFLDAPAIKSRYPDAFAVRIDGESMSPDIRHGDLVVVSLSGGAANGQPAVVQLAGQIGVTCKLFRRAGATVHLVGINDQYAPQSFPAGQVVWAFRVVARVRG